ncbi:MAG: TlpA disulfide reductase family protein [Chloroflexota bacterium]|nr:TlpA disulfide reductase family protein [Chloroflexota bacterium]
MQRNVMPSEVKALSKVRKRLGPVGLLCLAVLIFATACGPSAQTVEPGNGASAEAAPDFALTLFGTETRQAGETLRLSDLAGKPVVLNFWFPSCPPCVAEMPEFERVYQSHKADGVEFVGVQLVGIDTAEDGQNFVNEVGVTYALGPDEDDIIMKYQVNGFPMTVFIDQEQNIVRKWQGILDEEKLEEILAEIVH